MTPGEIADRLDAWATDRGTAEVVYGPVLDYSTAESAAAMLRELTAENARLKAALDNLYADTIPIEEFEEVDRPSAGPPREARFVERQPSQGLPGEVEPAPGRRCTCTYNYRDPDCPECGI